MTTATELFNQSNSTTTETATTTTTAPVDTLVGEGKKFKTIEDLAKGKLEADAYIEQLKAQNAALQKEASERELLETLVARLENGNEPVSNHSNLSNFPSNDQQMSAPDLPDIDFLVERKMSEIESKRTRSQNLQRFKDESRKVLGDSWETTLKGQMERLGLDEATLVTIAVKSPEAALKALGYTASSEGFVRPINSSIQTQPGVGNGNTRNFAYYENIRKTDPKRYNTTAMQSEIHKAALDLKDKFYSNNG
jgi:hypothetical protein